MHFLSIYYNLFNIVVNYINKYNIIYSFIVCKNMLGDDGPLKILTYHVTGLP